MTAAVDHIGKAPRRDTTETSATVGIGRWNWQARPGLASLAATLAPVLAISPADKLPSPATWGAQ